MAIQALTAEYVEINSVDESANLKSATLAVDVNQLDSTDFASGGWTEMIGGLKSGTLSLEVQDDVAASAIDSKLWALIGTVVTFKVRLSSASIGASNPSYEGSILVTEYNIGGAVGDLATKSLTFPVTGAVSRAVA